MLEVINAAHSYMWAIFLTVVFSIVLGWLTREIYRMFFGNERE